MSRHVCPKHPKGGSAVDVAYPTNVAAGWQWAGDCLTCCCLLYSGVQA